MINKKWIIIGVVISTFILLIFIFLKNRNTNISTSTEPVIPNNINSFNTGDIRSELVDNSTSNSFTPSSLENKKIIVENLDNASQVKDALSKFEASKTSVDMTWTNINNKSNANLTVNQFVKAIGTDIYSPIRRLLNPKELDFISCKSSDGTEGKGVVLTTATFNSYRGDYNADLDSFMKTWEKTMLRDMAPVLFPNINFSQNQLDQVLDFKDVEYDYAYAKAAEVVLPDGRKSFVIYDLILDFIVISNSPQCIDIADYQLFTPDGN